MKIILSGNCYWCVEAMYQRIDGCTSVYPGFFHFNEPNLGKVEAVEIDFDTQIISFEEILDVFFITHNPTLVDWNNCNFPLNRSSIIYNLESQHDLAKQYIDYLRGLYEDKVHTRCIAMDQGEFIATKDVNFFMNNPQDGYCTSIIKPKLKKLEEQLPWLLR